MRGPRRSELVEVMRSLDLAYGEKAYRLLIDEMMSPTNEAKDRIAAAKIILEHARGKPKQSVEVTGGLSMDLLGVIDTAHKESLRKAAGG